MSDYGGTFEEDFFPDTKIEHLELDILNDAWQDLQAEIAANSWPIDEGLRFILATGLAALRAERQREQVKNKPEADLEAELDRLQRERMQIDGRYAVMKFRTYQFMQDARTLAIKLNVCQIQLEGLQQANAQLRARLEQKADV
jgi:chromosome segregation ATPase